MQIVRQLLRVGIAVLMCPGIAAASPVTLTASDFGHYTRYSDGSVSNVSGNYIVGYVGNQTGPFVGREWRNYFAFDLSSVTGDIVAATLRVTGGAADQLPFSTGLLFEYTIYDVTTPVDQLLAGHSASTFADLGSGHSFGSTNVTLAHSRADSAPATIDFSADGLASLNAARGSLFAFGGATQIPSLRTDFFGEIFAFDLTFPDYKRELVLTTTPEPATIIYTLTGLGALIRSRRSLFKFGGRAVPRDASAPSRNGPRNAGSTKRRNPLTK
jgi:hypothetical protein